MMPPQDRIQYMFRFRESLLEHADEIARMTTKENGKTLAESRAELQRGIENVEVSCGMPTMMQGYNLEDVARGIDEMMIRQPLGVTAAITPFNFLVMIQLWFMPYALTTSNTFILKPSERVPLTAKFLFELLEKNGLPKGVVNLVVTPNQQATRSSITLQSAPSASLGPCPLHVTSMAKARFTASACNVRAEPKTMSSLCPTPTWR
jgi:acyl-CoA reductase-like NAD-dependent aldehyde dehydrogenase